MNEQVPQPVVEEGIRIDHDDETLSSTELDRHALKFLAPSASHLEMAFFYGPTGRPVDAPEDGTHMGALISNFRSVSRGSVGKSSRSITGPPVVDPNCCASHVDRHILRYSVRRVLKLLADSLSDVFK